MNQTTALLKDQVNRRQALKMSALGAATLAFARNTFSSENGQRKMTINLMPGMIGVQAKQQELVELAHGHGFESVEPYAHELAEMDQEAVSALLQLMKSKGVVFGAAGMPVDFRGEQSQFEEGMKSLPKLAKALQRAGVNRVGTWLMPGHGSLTYLQNFKQHAARLREVSKVLGDHGHRFGLEYVGTKTLRDRFRYEFVHTMAETKELIAEIGIGNVGFILDSWHWWNADESTDEILTLKNSDVVAVDLNDAPAGIPKEKQMDGQRELPMATGVIPVKPFLEALQKLGYDGPVRAEPFNKPLNELDNEAACAKTAEALRKAFALIGS